MRIYLLLKHLSLDRDKDHRFESTLMGIDTSQKGQKITIYPSVTLCKAFI